MNGRNPKKVQTSKKRVTDEVERGGSGLTQVSTKTVTQNDQLHNRSNLNPGNDGVLMSTTPTTIPKAASTKKAATWKTNLYNLPQNPIHQPPTSTNYQSQLTIPVPLSVASPSTTVNSPIAPPNPPSPNPSSSGNLHQFFLTTKVTMN